MGIEYFRVKAKCEFSGKIQLLSKNRGNFVFFSSLFFYFIVNFCLFSFLLSLLWSLWWGRPHDMTHLFTESTIASNTTTAHPRLWKIFLKSIQFQKIKRNFHNLQQFVANNNTTHPPHRRFWNICINSFYFHFRWKYN